MSVESSVNCLSEDVVLANGPTHPQLGIDVAKYFGVPIAQMNFTRFADTEPLIGYTESLRGKTVIALQTFAAVDGYPVTDSYYIQKQMIYAAGRAHAKKIIAVSPAFIGARQDKSVLGYESVTGKLNMNEIRNAGASQCLVFDIHNRSILEHFELTHTADNAESQTALPLLVAKLGQLMVGRESADFVMVSPDEGHTKDIRPHADALGINLISMVKERDSSKEQVTHDRGDFSACLGKICFILDDMIGTSGTLISAADMLHAAGAAGIFVAATHPYFSPTELDNGGGEISAAQRIAESHITGVYTTDTMPIRADIHETLEKAGKQLVVIPIAKLLAASIREMVNGGSVSSLTKYPRDPLKQAEFLVSLSNNYS